MRRDGQGAEAEAGRGRRRRPHRAPPEAVPLHRHGEPADLRVSLAAAYSARIASTHSCSCPNARDFSCFLGMLSVICFVPRGLGFGVGD